MIRRGSALVKTLVFVIVPYDLLPRDIESLELLLLEKHRFDPDEPHERGSRRYDYLVGTLRSCLRDSVAHRRLPPNVLSSYCGEICDIANVPSYLVPGALVTPDGEWYDMSDFGWRMLKEPSDENRAALARWTERYQGLISAHRDCWVVATWVHS
jgi:hypothetical protein